MDGPITVRPCAEADVEAVLALWARAAAPHSKPDTPEGVLVRLRRDRELFLIAFDGDAIVGSLMAGWDGWRGNLYRMAVAPEHRRRGVARRLLEEAERRLVALGCTRLYASVVAASPGAAPFWEAEGYAPNVGLVEYAKDIGLG